MNVSFKPDGRYFGAQARDKGVLQASVFDINIGKPVADAIIQILERKENGEETVIEELRTDNSGQSPEIELNSPPVDLSLQPETEVKPYAEYTLRISRSGFETKQIDGVQIFSDSTALQNVDLYPLESTENPTEEIIIKPHTLWGDFPPKIPEDDVKPLPPETGFVVLDQVVIPEYIVVHDGAPDDNSAPNYYILYKDYIKNVASSEIYSTWPDATIRANVLAIISFTLNRVFTEWYRSKGKNFTITSSTAYDHAFFFGRNYFKSISNIVDEVFANYITRPGIRQPLFTQYCDGKRVTCPKWMSQWGSKTLGDRGYSTIDILRNYYGSNIYLTGASKVSGVPSSYPGTNLTIGSRGNAVRTIQNQLNAISKNYPAIPKVVADGVYGAKTAESVKMFQKIFGLNQTGIVDYPTWYKISDVYVAVTKLAELT